MNTLRDGFAAGYDCLAAWSGLFDRINVFPVADGDTGANLRISLAPLRDRETPEQNVIEQLQRCATGNSGNIAAPFFQELCRCSELQDLAGYARQGRAKAWDAVADPRRGTMLSLFDALAESLTLYSDLKSLYSTVCARMQQAVLETTELLPDLRRGGVVDAGALAMYVFFDGFLHRVTACTESVTSPLELFAGRLAVRSSFQPAFTGDFCVDAVIEPDQNSKEIRDRIVRLGGSVVMIGDASSLKVHLHTPDPEEVRAQFSEMGRVIDWSGSAIIQEENMSGSGMAGKGPVHVMTDGAGSLTRAMARQHAITLLDSYVIVDTVSRPESLCDPDRIYKLMLAGRRVTTAQASNFERHLHYQNVCDQFGRTLYLCTGSAFTGNFGVCMAWKEKHDPDNLLELVDTGAASGRLALIALLTSRFAGKAENPEEVAVFARRACEQCEEFVFIDQLKFLVAGGRVSRAGSFFGDMLKMKPVVSPALEGVRKLGVVRNRKGQLAFALARLEARFSRSDRPMILLQYTNNRQWVGETVGQQVAALLPRAEIVLTPLSLTSGVHMGPGTWSLACGLPGA